MARSRRKRTSETRLPASTGSYVVSIVSAICIGLFFLFFYFSVRLDGDVGYIMGAGGVIVLIISVISLTQGIRVFRNKKHKLVSRIIALTISIFAVLCWGGVYLIGIGNR